MIMMAEWNNETTLKFLELYASEPVIWDPRENNHRYKHKVYEAWKRISAKMGNIPIEEMKSKKKSLMATFRPLLKKKKASMKAGVADDDIFEPVWFAFDLMESFLGPIYDVEETISAENENQESDTMVPAPLIELLESDEIPPAPTHENSAPTQENSKRTYTKRKINASSSSSKRLNLCLDEAQRKINESFETLKDVLERKETEEDECDIYGKLVAKKLRRYPEGMRDRIMYKIDGLLLDNPPDERASSSSCSNY